MAHWPVSRCRRRRQTYAADEVGDAFLRNYGYAEIVGEKSIPSRRLACGFLILGPSTLYPRHRHEAEEIYIPLRGTARWQQSDAVWRTRRPGAVIHHASGEPHSMQTGAEPSLAFARSRRGDWRYITRYAHIPRYRLPESGLSHRVSTRSSCR